MRVLETLSIDNLRKTGGLPSEVILFYRVKQELALRNIFSVGTNRISV